MGNHPGLPGPLPPYSPELNPVENLWHYLRGITGRTARTGITTRCRRSAVRSLCAVREDTETIKTVCAILHISQA